MKKSFLIVTFLSIFTFLYSFSNSVKASEQQTITDINKAFDVDKKDVDGNTITLTHDGKNGEVRGVATLKNKVDFSKGFTMKGDVQISGTGDYNKTTLGDGISFVFSTGNTNSIGLAGGGLGISGLDNAFGFKIDTYYNSKSTNNTEINKGDYESDPVDKLSDQNGDYYEPKSIFGSFVYNKNNNSNTSVTYYDKNQDRTVNPQSINDTSKLNASDGYIPITIQYSGNKDGKLSIDLGDMHWSIDVSKINSGNEMPKSFLIAGSNGVKTGQQAFKFHEVSYYKKSSVNVNVLDNNKKPIYDFTKDVFGEDKVLNVTDIGADTVKYNVDVEYSEDDKYKIKIPQIGGYHLTSVSDGEKDIPLPSDNILTGSLKNDEIKNLTLKYQANKLQIFDYDDNNKLLFNVGNDYEKKVPTSKIFKKSDNSEGTEFEYNDYSIKSAIAKYENDLKTYQLSDLSSRENENYMHSDAKIYLSKKNLPILVKKGKLIVKYEDEDNNVIKTDEFSDEFGKPYNIHPDKIDNYVYDSIVKGSLLGTYSDEATVVILKYKKNITPIDPVPTPPLSKGTVTVHYLDEHGKEFNKQVTSGNVGDSYSVSMPNDGNYQFTSVSKGNLNGNYIDGNIDVYLNYKIIKNDNNSNYDNNGLLKKDTIVYPTKSMNLYKSNRFSKTNLLRHYTNKPMVNKPIFVVDGHGKSKTGLLRYKVHEMNHKNRVGYITVRKDYVLPVYETNFKGKVTVISAGGINEYNNKNLTGKVAHYKQGQTLDVKGIVWNKRSTRYILNNGTFITANKTLVAKGVHKQVKSFTAKKGLTIYNDAQLSKKVKTVKKAKTMLIKNWDYSDKDNTLKHGSLRYRVSGGYVYANSKYIKNVK